MCAYTDFYEDYVFLEEFWNYIFEKKSIEEKKKRKEKKEFHF